MVKALFISVSFFIFIASGQAETKKIEKRCGWISNPSKDYLFITDSQASWIISAMNDYYAPGFEKISIPNPESDKYVRNNGGYGYFCGCMDVETGGGAALPHVKEIHSFKVNSIKTCLEDQNLPDIY